MLPVLNENVYVVMKVFSGLEMVSEGRFDNKSTVMGKIMNYVTKFSGRNQYLAILRDEIDFQIYIEL